VCPTRSDSRDAKENTMHITKIVIQAERTGNRGIEILRTAEGAQVVHVIDQPGVCMQRETLGFMRANDSSETRYALATKVAGVICGRTKQGEVNATNSMVHDFMNEIERLAGC